MGITGISGAQHLAPDRLAPLAARVEHTAITVLSPADWDRQFVASARCCHRDCGSGCRRQAAQAGGVLRADSPRSSTGCLVSQWKETGVVIDGLSRCRADRCSRWAALPDFTQRMMFLDLISYLPDDILAKVDRASMAGESGGECRCSTIASWPLPLRCRCR